MINRPGRLYVTRRLSVTKSIFAAVFVLAAVFMLAGCADRKAEKVQVDFGSEPINENVSIPADFGKEELIACYDTGKQLVYTLGTWHDHHLEQEANYSLHDIQSVIENVKPDMVLIECRESVFEKYGALDGPIEMIFIYSYCRDNGIPVGLIDYWQLDDTFVKNQNSTNDERDNVIANNILRKVSGLDKDKRVLVCYGSSHYFFQKPRMEKMGWTNVPLSDRAGYFKHNEEQFVYPESMEGILETCIEYMKTGYLEEARENVTDSSVMEYIENCSERGAEFLDLCRRMVIYKEEYYGG